MSLKEQTDASVTMIDGAVVVRETKTLISDHLHKSCELCVLCMILLMIILVEQHASYNMTKLEHLSC